MSPVRPTDLIPISSAAKLLSLSVDQLRRAEDVGLLTPIRTPGGHRRYDRAQVLSLKRNQDVIGRVSRRALVATAVIETRAQLNESDLKFRQLLATTGLAVETDAVGQVLFATPAFHRLFGTSERDYGRSIFTLVRTQDPPATRRLAARIRASDSLLEATIETFSTIGEPHWLAIRATAVRDHHGTVTAVRATALDLSRIQRTLIRSQFIMAHDPVTGLPNRHRLLEILDDWRRHSIPGAMCVLAVDNFEAILAELGYAYADALVTRIASALAELDQANPHSLFHLADHKFLWLGRGRNLTESAYWGRRAVKRLQQEKLFAVARVDAASIRASAGAVEWPMDARDAAAALQVALERRLRAGASNEEHVVLTDLPIGKRTQPLNSRRELFSALATPENMALHLRPVVRITDGLHMHYELVPLLLDPSTREALPAEVAAMIRDSGLCSQFELAILQKLVNQYQALTPGFRFALPISQPTLSNANAVIQIVRVATEHPDLAPRLILQVGQPSTTSAISDLRAVMRQLRPLKVRLALDGFGLLASNDPRLASVAPDYIKLDANLCKAAYADDEADILVAAVIQAKKLTAQVVATGVDHPNNLERLRDHGLFFADGLACTTTRPSPGERDRQNWRSLY